MCSLKLFTINIHFLDVLLEFIYKFTFLTSHETTMTEVCNMQYFQLGVGLCVTFCQLVPQLPHSYYFTKSILVLKFANKGVFCFRKSWIHIFLEKGGILVLTSVNLEKKGLILMSSVLPWKKVFIWAEKAVFYHKKGGSFSTEKLVFYRKKVFVLSWKVTVLPQKRGSFSNWRTRMGTTFPLSEGVWAGTSHQLAGVYHHNS